MLLNGSVPSETPLVFRYIQVTFCKRSETVGIGFHIALRCSELPKSLHVKTHSPSVVLFHNASSVTGTTY
ncbi:lactoylglutathione lyase [Desmospora sp. 8437]|nr:lactoylglutathione lyase [Desmospora sp. 8437]